MVPIMNHPEQSPKIIDVAIESMAFGGKGVARDNGKVYFVADGIEGDHARIEVLSETDRYGEAKIDTLLKPSIHRGPSPCPISDECGGCQWQGVPYSQQMLWKKQFITNALRRIGKLGEAIDVEVLPSPLENGYRNRIFVRARILKDGSLKIGYFKRGSRDFVPISKCPIANLRLNQFIDSIQTLSFTEVLKNHPIESEIKFRFEMQDLPAKNQEDPHILLSVYEPDDSNFPVTRIIEKFKTIAAVAWVGAAKDLHGAPLFEFETDLGATFHTAAGMFQQVNIPHNHTVRRLVKEAVDKIQPKRILDLFCGSGNLSLPLADGTRYIDGIEFSKRAIEAANYNVEHGKIKNAQYFAGDTEKFLWRAAKQGMMYDLIIADPPRDGMFKALIPLMKLKAQTILYISCDPTTLSRDLSSLCKRDYRVQRFVALDFFPNTYHIESFVILERTDRP